MGIVMCLFFAMWFSSGIVMMYVPFPLLTSSERLDGLPDLNASKLLVGPQALVNSVGSQNTASLRLTTILDRPAYLLRSKAGKYIGRFADTGEPIPSVTAANATVTASSFYGYSQLSAEKSDLRSNFQHNTTVSEVFVDQWTVSNSLNSHRPLFKVSFNNATSTNLYVSSSSGEVVRDTHKTERTLNWFGANLHWIYPVQLRKHPSVWHWVVVILSIWGIISVITGGVIGMIRLRFRNRYRGTEVTPYKGINKYHHLFGLVFFAFFLTYMTSGLLSMNPLGMFNTNAPCQLSERNYRGAFPITNSGLDINNIRVWVSTNSALKEIVFHHLNDHLFPLGVSKQGNTILTPADPVQLRSKALRAIEAAYSKCSVSPLVLDVEIMTDYDNYYYSHRGTIRPLPAYRVRLNDEASTWIYINAKTAQWVLSKTQKQRVQRWLYNGLHSLDFSFLIERRPLWDLVVIVLCVFGFGMALTSLVLAARRLKLRLKKS